MLNKNDPLVAAVQKVMQTNQAERDAVRVVNEKFGITDRKALPRERQHEWDSAYQSLLSEATDPSKYSEKQKRLAGTAGNPNEIDAPDLAHVRKHGGKHIEEAEKMKGDDPCWKGYEMIGMKKKGGKEVPNCVPVKEEGVPGKAIRGDVVTGGSSVTTVPSKPTSVQPSDQSALKKKIQSVIKEASEKQKNKVGKVMKEFGKGSLHSGKGGPVVTDRKQAVAIALSQAGLAKAKKKLEEGFNNRHDLSVTASVEEQVVAGQLNEQETYADYDPAKETRNKFAKLSGATSGRRVRNFLSQRKFLKANPPQGSLKAEPGNYRVNKAIDQAKAFASGAVGYGSDYEKFYPRAAETGKLAGIGSMLLPGRPVVAAGQATAKAPAVATQTTNVANKFRANLANRRYNVSGAQQKPPQNVAPAAQSSVPQIAQGTGQGNRLAAIRRPDRGPWGSTRQADRPPSAGSSQPRNTVPSGTMAARLRQQGQQAQQNRAGGSTVAATQSAARTRLSQQTQQSRVGTNTTAANQSAARTSLAQRVQNMRAGAPMAGARRVAQTAFSNDVTTTSTAPKAAQADTGPEKIKTSTQTTTTAGKISDRDIMNDPRYKAAVNKVGGEKGARKIAVGKTVDPVGKFAKGETIWSKVKSQLEKERSQPKTTTSVVGGQGIAAIPGGASNVPSRPASTPTSPMASQGSSGATQSKVLPQRQTSQSQSMSQNAAIGSMQPRSGQQGMTVTQRRDSNYNSGVRGR